MKAVDISTGVAGQWAAKLLAMGGAEVIRPAGGCERLPAHADYLDRAKRIVPWTGPELLEGVDLVFTTFDGGERQGFANGLQIPASCIEVTTSTFGATGPYSFLRGGPLAAWAAGGYLHITGKPEREPLIGPEFLCEYSTGYMAAIGAEAALHLRSRTGRVRSVDVSAMESMLLMHQSTFTMLAAGMIRKRTGRYYETYPLTARPCRDGHVLLGVVTDEEFDRFTLAIGRPELSADPRFADKDERFVNRDALDDEMEPFLLAHDGEEVVASLHAQGVAAAQVAGIEGVSANPQLAFREFWHRGPVPGNPVPQPKVFATAKEPPKLSPLARERVGTLPLEGLVVADFSVYWAGPSCTRMLAELGARVIWVERPGSRTTNDPNASSGTPMDVFYLKNNRRKQSLVLDLNSAEGKAAARRLVAHADVLVENNRPGVMDKLGLGAAELCAAHPGLVYVSLAGYGASGPWSQRRSYGPAIGAASGIEGRTGYPDDEPLRLGHALPDPTGGLVGALAVLRGLRQREATGQGGWFDISQLEAYVAISGEDFLAPRPVERIGNRSRWGFSQGVYPCADDDQWIAIRLADNADRARFTALTGIDPDDHAAIAAFTRDADKFALMRRLQEAGLEAFPALTPPDLAADPHLRARNFLLDIVREGRVSPIPGTAFAGLADAAGRAPIFGEHNTTILAELAALRDPAVA
jgi:crotonobetainyl-CoA:carnitine CoA-transferase CaiB-like acyl-CoA transferase